MAYLIGEPTVQQYFDANGDPLANGSIEFFVTGTSTPTPIYSDSAGTSLGTSVTLNSIGAPQSSGGTAVALFFDDSVTYKIIRKDAAGVAIAPTIDPYHVLKDAVGSPRILDNIAALQANTSGQLTRVTLTGHTTKGDGGGGDFWLDTSDTSTADDNAINIVDSQSPRSGTWKRLFSGAVNMQWFGAIGDASTNDTTACQNAADYAGQNGIRIDVPKVYSVTEINFDYDNVEVVATSPSAGFVARGTGSPIKSLLANRAVADKSLESVRFVGITVDGNELTNNCFELERFTRGCALIDCIIIDASGDGIDIRNSWSYALKRNRVKNCTGIGINQADVNNDATSIGNHVTECGAGWFIENAQGGFVAGNTSEYNKGVNFQAGGNALLIVGNYFEGFHSDFTGQGGEETCVILGTDTSAFVRSTFENYVNGGSVTASSFSGDGVELYNVIESNIKCNFSQSTRHPFAFDETWTFKGCKIDLSFDAYGANFDNPSIRNLTTSTTGGLDVLNGTNCLANTAVRTGDSSGIRYENQIEPNGTTGSLVDTRIIGNATVLYRYGKLESNTNKFTFDSVDRDNWYRFNNGLQIPVMTTTQRDNISTPENGLIIYNTTSGKYQGYKESGTAWVDFN